MRVDWFDTAMVAGVERKGANDVALRPHQPADDENRIHDFFIICSFSFPNFSDQVIRSTDFQTVRLCNTL
jgi:hypothetical protein